MSIKKTMATGISLLTFLSGCYLLKPETKMQKQAEKAQTLDAILVLGGEQNHSRSNHAMELYFQVKSKGRKQPLYFVLTGCQSGLLNEKCEKAESEIMKEYLLSRGIPQEVIKNEIQSKDTLTNIVYSQPILQNIGAKKIGVVTDKYHVSRGVWSAKRVLGKNYEIIGLPNETEGNFINNVQELLIKYAQQIDLSVAGVKSGDQKAFEKYINEKHPFYNKYAKGVYGTMINAYNIIHGGRK